MCGISGSVSLNARTFDRDVVPRMNDLMVHRGPDSAGTFACDRAAIGIRRLAINDVAGGAQPLFNETGDIALVINGELVAYQPIAEALLHDLASADQSGRVFATEQLPGQTHAVEGTPAAPAMRSFAPVRVPEGNYFMMGDNRDDSFDSRYWGPLSKDYILGKPILRLLPINKIEIMPGDINKK